MLTTIQQSLRPLFLMCFIVGLGMYPIKQPNESRFHRWIAFLSILYCLAIWFVYGYVLSYMFTIFPPIVLFQTITIFVMLAINNLTTIMSAIFNFYHQKNFQIYMKKLAAVDDTLEKLGTPKMYQKLHTLSKSVIIGWIVNSLIINIYGTIWWFKYIKQISPSWGFLLLHITNYPTHANEFADLTFIILLWYIGTRFDKVNDHMHCLLLKEDHRLKYMWKKPVTHGYFLHRHNFKRTLWTSMHLHLELCRIARELNIIFEVQIIFEMVTYLAYLTSLCYYLCRILEQKHKYKRSLQHFIGYGSTFLTYLIRLYAVNHICESVKNKANNIDKIIHQLTNNLRYSDIWKEIDFFVLQLTQHPLKFTGLGLFYLGNKFLHKFFTTILTFVIIMIQLNMQSVADT